MIKRFLSVALAGLLICTGGVRLTSANSKEDKQARLAYRIKEGIARLGTGPEARVKLTLRNKTRLEGYVSETSEEHFVVLNSITGTPMKVAFSDVQQVKGNNLSKGVKIAITVAALALIAVLLLAGAPRT
jgi:hypothetical protein